MLSACGTSSIASDLLRDDSYGEKYVGFKRLSALSALVINPENVPRVYDFDSAWFRVTGFLLQFVRHGIKLFQHLSRFHTNSRVCSTPPFKIRGVRRSFWSFTEPGDGLGERQRRAFGIGEVECLARPTLRRYAHLFRGGHPSPPHRSDLEQRSDYCLGKFGSAFTSRICSVCRLVCPEISNTH